MPPTTFPNFFRKSGGGTACISFKEKEVRIPSRNSPAGAKPSMRLKGIPAHRPQVAIGHMVAYKCKLVNPY